MKKPVKHSTFYIYDDKIYRRIKALAQIQGKPVTEFMWDELTTIIEAEYGRNTLSPFLGEAIGGVKFPPFVTDSLNEQKAKFMRMDTKDLDEYEKILLKHIKIFKTERRDKK